MFRTIKRIIDWCGEFRGKLYIGFVFSFFSTWFAAMPVMVAAYTVARGSPGRGRIRHPLDWTQFGDYFYPCFFKIFI